MTWTFDETKLSSSRLYQVRSELGDINSTATVTLADEEITHAIATERNFWGAAARCAEMLATRYLAKADVRLGRSLMVNYSKMADQFRALSKDLRKKSTGTVVPWAGGASVSEKLAYQTQTDAVQPVFAKTMQGNPWAGGYNSDVDDSQSNTSNPFAS